MACGCGKKKIQRSGSSASTLKRLPAGAQRAEVAKTYQSATMSPAPRAPVVTRKTV